jgi:hypothetical protein
MRSANASGNGRCFLPVQQILDTLQISKTTLKRYYSDPDFFYQTHTSYSKPPEITNKNYLVIYPVALTKVCLEYKLRELGSVAEINQKDLVNAKKFSALSIILDLQKRSRYIANKSLKNAALQSLGKKRLPKGYGVKKALTDDQIYSLFETSGDQLSELNLGILKLNKKKLFVNDSWVVFGGSQSTAAYKADKSTRTINRRLRGFTKLAVAQASSDNFSIYEELQFNDKEQWTNESNKYFTEDGYCYERLCSIYKPILHLFNCRYLRVKLSKLWSKVSNSLESTLNLELSIG